MGEALKDKPVDMTTTAGVASNFIEETAQFVKHYLPGVMAVAFGGGVLVGWFIAPDLKTRFYVANKQRRQKLSEDKAYKRAISRWEGEGGALLSTNNGGKK
jgi:hypothetical protein